MALGMVLVNGGGKNDSSAGRWRTDSSSTGKITEWFLSERLFLLSLVSFLQVEPRLVVILVPPSLDVLLLSEPQWKGRRVFVCPPTAATVCAKVRGGSHRYCTKDIICALQGTEQRNTLPMNVTNKLKRNFSVHSFLQMLYSEGCSQSRSQLLCDFAHEQSWVPTEPTVCVWGLRAELRRCWSQTDGKDFFYPNFLRFLTNPILPICKQLLAPAATATPKIKAQLRRKYKAQKHYFKRYSRIHAILSLNQGIRLKTQKGPDKIEMVKRRCTEPHSYIESEERDDRHNRRHTLL